MTKARVPLARALVLALVPAALATLPPPSSSSTSVSRSTPERAAARFAAGDLAGARDDYRFALATDPGNVPAWCGLARVESELAEGARGESRREILSAAVQHARTAVDKGAGHADAHLALAVALERQSRHEGPRTRLSLVREVKAEVDRALALDPRNAEAYHVRALWHRRLAKRGPVERFVAPARGGAARGASMGEALRDLERAVALEPESVCHRVELARTWRDLGRKAEARRTLERALALPAASRPGERRDRSEARELLARLR